jgi:hypothetical protein
VATVTVQQLDAVELGRRADALDLRRQLVDLGLDGVTRRGRERAVLVLHGQLADALEHRVDLVEVALGGLHEADAVLDVALGGLEATDLRPHLLGDPEAGRVVGGTVDAEARGQPLHRLRQLVRRLVELPVGVGRLDVVLDAKGHARSP